MKFLLRSAGSALVAMLFLTCVSLGHAATPTSDPLIQVKQEVQQVIAVFQDETMTLSARREKLRQMSNQYFDFTDMASSALGYQWRKLTPQQRDEFVPVFATFIQSAYLSKLEDYSLQKIREAARSASINFTGERFDSPDYAEVFSNIMLAAQKDPVQVNYRMHRTTGGWRIYDLTILGISIIQNYRNQFRRVIDDKGYAQLVSDLKLKQQQLQQYMDQPHPIQTPR